MSEGDVGVSEAPVVPERVGGADLGAPPRGRAPPSRAAPEGAGPAAGSSGGRGGAAAILGEAAGLSWAGAPARGAPAARPAGDPLSRSGLAGRGPGPEPRPVPLDSAPRAEGEAARGREAGAPALHAQRAALWRRRAHRAALLGALVPGPGAAAGCCRPGLHAWVRVRPWISNPLVIRCLLETQAPASGSEGGG